MSTVLARLREDLDVLPSPVPDRPGLLVRDPFRYSDVAIVLPPPLIECLTCFDGAHTDADLRALVVQLVDVMVSPGRPDPQDTAESLMRGLSEAGFLDDATFRRIQGERRHAFAQSPVRHAAFADGAYPNDQTALSRTVTQWIARGPAPPPPGAGLMAVAAPHVSPAAGISSYGAAYQALDPAHADRTFVIVGTSHYGRPNRLGLTRKPFETPLGQTTTDTALVDRLIQAAGGAVEVEDYCHAVEHSIEFQVLFLQTLYGPAVKILPVLCGPFMPSGPPTAARPEDDPQVARALDALGNLQATEGSRLLWVLGVDMAHVGRRYGDNFTARVREGALNDVAARDQARLERVVDGDADGFWRALHERGQDDLKWCGSAPLYAFLRANPGVRGRVLNYDQWNIDEHSVVSFGALAFTR